MKKILIAAIFFITTTFSFAESTNKKIDMDNSSFKWKATKVTGGHNGEIKINEDKSVVKLDDNMLAKGTKIVMDMTSITVDDISGKTAKNFLDHVLSKDFFEVDKENNKNTEATLEVTNVSDNELEAKVTIKGIPNTEKIKFEKSGQTYKGTFTFDRTKYGITFMSKDSSIVKKAADKLIHHDVKIDFEVTPK